MEHGPAMELVQQELASVKAELQECTARFKAELQKDPAQRDVAFLKYVQGLQDKEGRLQDEKLLLLRAQAGTTPDLKETIKQALAEDRLQASSSRPSVDFSRVGSTTATALYQSLNIALEDGHYTAPLEEPQEGFPECGAFNMADYPNEEAATADLLAHMTKGLGLQPGVVLGRGGFQLIDLHKQNHLYELRFGDELYKGGLDGGIVPYGVSRLLPVQQLRCGIEIKHSDEHKALYREQHAGQPSDGMGQGTHFSGTVQGQALMETLAACVYAEYPKVMLLLSSFDYNVLLELNAGTATHWEGISFNAAMYKLGAFLRTCSPERRYCFAPSSLPQQESEPILRLRKKLRPTNVLVEQLDSITAGDDSDAKFAAALELIHAYRPSTHALGLMYS